MLQVLLLFGVVLGVGLAVGLATVIVRLIVAGIGRVIFAVRPRARR